MEYSFQVKKFEAVNFIMMALLILAYSLSSIYVNYSILSIIFLIMFILASFPSKNITSKIFAFLYSILLLLLVEGGLIEFDFIPQAKYLLDINSSVFYWFSNGHVHAVRLLIAYPGYLLSEFLNVELNKGFSYYTILMFTMIFLLIVDTLQTLKKQNIPFLLEIKMFIALIPLIILPLIMNGRLIAAYLGFIILIRIFIDLFSEKQKGRIEIFSFGLVGLILTMVSSGTMTVAFIYILFLTYIFNKGKLNRKMFVKRSLLITIVFSPVIYAIFSYFWLMLMRNINYYGGGLNGVINMFNHGAGKFLMLNNISVAAILIFAFIILSQNIIVLRKILKKQYKVAPLIIAVNISLYGLLFGFSTGLIMIPPLLILILLYF